MLVNKTGSLETKEIIELVLAGAGIFILILLMWNLFSPSFDKTEKTAKSYFETLKKEIRKADNNGVGEFEIWYEPKNTKFYVVYFGSKIRGEYDGNTFLAEGVHNNYICVCYVKDKKSFCNYCMDLDSPVIGDEFEYNVMMYFKKGDKIEITKNKTENFYYFLTPYD